MSGIIWIWIFAAQLFVGWLIIIVEADKPDAKYHGWFSTGWFLLSTVALAVFTYLIGERGWTLAFLVSGAAQLVFIPFSLSDARVYGSMKRERLDTTTESERHRQDVRQLIGWAIYGAIALAIVYTVLLR